MLSKKFNGSMYTTIISIRGEDIGTSDELGDISDAKRGGIYPLADWSSGMDLTGFLALEIIFWSPYHIHWFIVQYIEQLALSLSLYQ